MTFKAFVVVIASIMLVAGAAYASSETTGMTTSLWDEPTYQTTPEKPDRRLMVVAMITAWMLWQELQFLDDPSPPLWHLEGRFSGESTCLEARQIRLIEQLLRADSGGPTVLNQPTIEEGTIWVQWPGGQHAKMRFICLPEMIDPEEPWFGHQNLDPSLQTAARY